MGVYSLSALLKSSLAHSLRLPSSHFNSSPPTPRPELGRGQHNLCLPSSPLMKHSHAFGGTSNSHTCHKRQRIQTRLVAERHLLTVSLLSSSFLLPPGSRCTFFVGSGSNCLMGQTHRPRKTKQGKGIVRYSVTGTSGPLFTTGTPVCSADEVEVE